MARSPNAEIAEKEDSISPRRRAKRGEGHERDPLSSFDLLRLHVLPHGAIFLTTFSFLCVLRELSGELFIAWGGEGNVPSALLTSLFVTFVIFMDIVLVFLLSAQ